MRTRVEFRLTMPGVGSWNGHWSGEGRDYLLWRSLSKDELATSGIDAGKTRWSYAWRDGWRAAVTARIMKRGERRKRSAGFNGYEWMIANILGHGDARHFCELPGNDHAWRERSHDPGWQECCHCHSTQQVPSTGHAPGGEDR